MPEHITKDEIAEIVKAAIRESKEISPASEPTPAPARTGRKLAEWLWTGGFIVVITLVFSFGYYSFQAKSALEAVPKLKEATDDLVDWKPKQIQRTKDLTVQVQAVQQESLEVFTALGARFGNRVHVVTEGETFDGLAREFGISIGELKDLNPQITDIASLKAGDKIFYTDFKTMKEVKNGSPE